MDSLGEPMGSAGLIGWRTAFIPPGTLFCSTKATCQTNIMRRGIWMELGR
jgi:hypothetical protein